jgi:hypothetical protein
MAPIAGRSRSGTCPTDDENDATSALIETDDGNWRVSTGDSDKDGRVVEPPPRAELTFAPAAEGRRERYGPHMKRWLLATLSLLGLMVAVPAPPVAATVAPPTCSQLLATDPYSSPLLSGDGQRYTKFSNGRLVSESLATGGAVSSIAIVDQSEYLIAHDARRVAVRSATTASIVDIVSGASVPLDSALTLGAFSANGEFLTAFSAGTPSIYRVYTATTGSSSDETALMPVGTVVFAGVSDDGRFLLVSNGESRLIDRVLRRVSNLGAYVPLGLSRDGSSAYLADPATSTVVRWDRSTGSLTTTATAVGDVRMLGSGPWFVAETSGPRIVYNAETGSRLRFGAEKIDTDRLVIRDISDDGLLVLNTSIPGSEVRLTRADIPGTFARDRRMEFPRGATFVHQVEGNLPEGTVASVRGFDVPTQWASKPDDIGRRDVLSFSGEILPSAPLGDAPVSFRAPNGCRSDFRESIGSIGLDVTPKVVDWRFEPHAVLHPGETTTGWFSTQAEHDMFPIAASAGVTAKQIRQTVVDQTILSSNEFTAEPGAALGFRSVTFQPVYPSPPTVTSSYTFPNALLVRSWSGEFHPVVPQRIVDTRSALGHAGPLGPGETASFGVVGHGGVPMSGVAAVIVNATVDAPTEDGFLSAFPSGSARPTASNLNFRAGQSVPNLVTVGVGPDGGIALFNTTGSADVILDVVGWYSSGDNRTRGSAFAPVTPQRLTDTRNGGVPLGPGGVLTIPVSRPELRTRAVALNVTVTAPTTSSFLSVLPTPPLGPPGTSNLNYSKGATVANMVVVPVDQNGYVYLYNSAGSVHAIVDLLGAWDDGTNLISNGQFVPALPRRVLDTREGLGAPRSRVPAEGTLRVDLTGLVPPNSSAVVLNVTATRSAGGGFLTVWPGTTAPPLASSLNFLEGQAVPNLVTVPIGPDGAISIFCGGSDSDIIADVLGTYGSIGISS